MPFPPTSAAAADDFDLSGTLARISALQAQLTSNAQASGLLRRQISRENAALKRDRTALKMLEEGLRGSKEVRRRKERGLHPLARRADERERVRAEDADVDVDG